MGVIDRMDQVAGFGVMIRDSVANGRVWNETAGLPLITYNITKADVERMHRAMVLTARMCLEAGAKAIYPDIRGVAPIERPAHFEAFQRSQLRASDIVWLSYHPNGTCKMGRDAKTSVVGLDHETHDVHGLYVVDASTLPGPRASIRKVTIMAARHAGRRLHRRTARSRPTTWTGGVLLHDRPRLLASARSGGRWRGPTSPALGIHHIFSRPCTSLVGVGVDVVVDVVVDLDGDGDGDGDVSAARNLGSDILPKGGHAQLPEASTSTVARRTCCPPARRSPGRVPKGFSGLTDQLPPRCPLANPLQHRRGGRSEQWEPDAASVHYAIARGSAMEGAAIIDSLEGLAGA